MALPLPKDSNNLQSGSLNILCLDGGGVRSLSQLLVLEELMNRLGSRLGFDEQVKPCEVFDLICGTSAGGLLALMLGRLQMSVGLRIAVYKEISRKAFSDKNRKNLALDTRHSAQPLWNES